ncbi:hypothetical protein ACFQZC_33590 [Streptacidiphilus monticola]
MSSPSTGASRSSSPWAVGATVFAGVLLVCNGVISILEGITGIAKDDVLVSTPATSTVSTSPPGAGCTWRSARCW